MIKDTSKEVKKNIALRIALKFGKIFTFLPKLLRIDERVTEPKQRKTMYYLYGILGAIILIGGTLSAIGSGGDFDLAIGITLAISTLLFVLTLGIIFTVK